MSAANMAALIEHLPDCAAPEPLTYLDRRTGRVATKCRTCGRRVIHDEAQMPPKPAPASNYRCRDHHGEPVTWRGTGCDVCTTERASRKTRRQRRATRVSRRDAWDFTTPTTEGEHA
jgi:hypothetical protein